jgi:hypothetical protein
VEGVLPSLFCAHDMDYTKFIARITFDYGVSNRGESSSPRHLRRSDAENAVDRPGEHGKGIVK